MSSFVYILASKKNGTLYVGVTTDLGQRIHDHKQGTFERSFTSLHGVTRLVWYQEFAEIGEAIIFEKRIKRWRRAWKTRLIEEMIPDWFELYRGTGW